MWIIWLIIGLVLGILTRYIPIDKKSPYLRRGMSIKQKKWTVENFQVKVLEDTLEISYKDVRNDVIVKSEPVIIQVFDIEKLDRFNDISVNYITKDISTKDALKIIDRLLSGDH